MFYYILPVLPVGLICNTSIKFSPNQVEIAPSPATSTSKLEQNCSIAISNHRISSPYNTSSPIPSTDIISNISRLSSVDSGKLKKLIKIFNWVPHSCVPDAIKLAKYSNEEITNDSLHQALWHALPGGFIKGLRGYVAGKVTSPPDCSKQHLNSAINNDIECTPSVYHAVLHKARLPPESRPLHFLMNPILIMYPLLACLLAPWWGLWQVNASTSIVRII